MLQLSSSRHGVRDEITRFQADADFVDGNSLCRRFKLHLSGAVRWADKATRESVAPAAKSGERQFRGAVPSWISLRAWFGSAARLRAGCDLVQEGCGPR